MFTRTTQLAVRATPEQIWDAFTDGSVTPAFYFCFEAQFDLAPGARYAYVADDAEVIVGRVLAVEPARELRMTFNGFWQPEVAALPESEVTLRLHAGPMPVPGITMVTLVHAGLADAAVADHLAAGWAMIISGLKTLL